MMENVTVLVETASQSIFLFLARQTIHSALVLLLLSPLLLFMRRRNVRWQTGLYALVMLRLLLPPDFHSPYSLAALTAWLGAKFYSGDAALPHVFTPIFPTLTPPGAQAGPVHPLLSWTVVAVGFWLLGVIVLFIRYAVTMSRFRRRVRHSAVVHDRLLLTVIEKWQERFQIRRPVQLLSYHENISPFTSGCLRRKIVLPAFLLASGDAAMLEIVIAHEMAHIRRHDNLLLKMQAVVQIVYFFNPLVWFVASRLNLFRECLCDSLVISAAHQEPRQYFTGLLKALRHINDPISTMPAMAELGSIKRKMAFRFSNYGGHMKKSHYAFYLIIWLLFAWTILPMATERSVALTRHLPESWPEQPLLLQSSGNAAEVGQPVFAAPLKTWKKTLGFGPAKHPITGQLWAHNGVDLKASNDAEVMAVADGVVVEAVSEYRINEGAGKYVLLRHSADLQSRYTHLNSISVKSGDAVRRGQVLGRVGTTGLSTGPHLHLEIWETGTAVDPVKYIPILAQ